MSLHELSHPWHGALRDAAIASAVERPAATRNTPQIDEARARWNAVTTPRKTSYSFDELLALFQSSRSFAEIGAASTPPVSREAVRLWHQNYFAALLPYRDGGERIRDEWARRRKVKASTPPAEPELRALWNRIEGMGFRIERHSKKTWSVDGNLCVILLPHYLHFEGMVAIFPPQRRYDFALAYHDGQCCVIPADALRGVPGTTRLYLRVRPVKREIPGRSSRHGVRAADYLERWDLLRTDRRAA